MMYLDNAATTLRKPASVYASLIKNSVFGSGNAGRGGHKQSVRAAEVIVDAQDAVARLFNISNPQNIIFTQNATYALNTAIFGTLRNGGHVVVTEMEHNSVLRPVYLLGNYTVVRADRNGLVRAEDVEAAIREDTRLIVCTHASNVCGTIQPVNEIGRIAHKRGIPFLADTAQTAGCLDIDAEEMQADMIAFSGHKGLMGPLGTGGLYVKNPDALEPFALGGTGSKSESTSQPDFMPDKFHSGTMNTPAIAALTTGVNFVLRHGAGAIGEYEASLAEIFRDNLMNMKNVTVYGGKESVATVAFNVDGLSSEETFERLKGKAALRAGYHCAPLAHKALGTSKTGVVRASFGFFNTKKDAKRISELVYKISRDLKG